MSQTSLNQKPTIVVGLGLTGLSCVRFLSQQACTLVVMDSRENPSNLASAQAEYPNVEFVCGAFDVERLKGAERIVLSPGVPLATPAIQAAKAAGIPVIGDIDLFAENAQAPVIAITGSNGKSTVTTLVAEMAKAAGLRVAAGGNLGTPALDLLNEVIELYVLELSSFQLETSHVLSPKVACVLNMSEDHMDRYESFSHYVSAKHRIFERAENVVVNMADEHSVPRTDAELARRNFSIAEKQGANAYFEASNDPWLICNGQQVVRRDEIALKGQHNLGNAAAAALLAASAGVAYEGISKALREFKGLAHRCEWVSNVAGVDYINDSKGTNTGAAITAIESFGELHDGIVWIAGGVSKDSDMSVLAPSLAQYVRASILFGQDAEVIQSVALAHSEVQTCSSLSEAVRSAANIAKPGECVLFSPACASFDMFANYEARGDAFIDEVHAL